MERYDKIGKPKRATQQSENLALTDCPIKICHLGHKNMLERSGGVEVVVYELTTRMAAMGLQYRYSWPEQSC